MILRNRLKLTRVRDWREQQEQQQLLLNKLEFRTGKCNTF
jgi:hypothetical protein